MKTPNFFDIPIKQQNKKIQLNPAPEINFLVPQRKAAWKSQIPQPIQNKNNQSTVSDNKSHSGITSKQKRIKHLKTMQIATVVTTTTFNSENNNMISNLQDESRQYIEEHRQPSPSRTDHDINERQNTIDLSTKLPNTQNDSAIMVPRNLSNNFPAPMQDASIKNNEDLGKSNWNHVNLPPSFILQFNYEYKFNLKAKFTAAINVSNDTLLDNTSQHSSTTDTSTSEEYHEDTIVNQLVIANIKENHPFGNLLDDNKPPNTVRIYIKNINSIKSYNTWTTGDTACSTLKKLNIDIFVVNELNINWNTKHCVEARNIAQKQNNYHTAQISYCQSLNHGTLALYY
jgi:hypothetical protein